MRCHKTKPIGFNNDYVPPRVMVIELTRDESEKIYYSMCEGIQEAARKAREEAPNSGLTAVFTRDGISLR